MQSKSEHLVIFSERLTSLMKEMGLDGVAVAEGTGLTPTAISYYRNGKRLPGAEELFKIAKFFHKPMEYFLGEEITPPDRPLAEIMEEPLSRLSEREVQRAMRASGMSIEQLRTVISFMEQIAQKVESKPPTTKDNPAYEDPNSALAREAAAISRRAEELGLDRDPESPHSHGAASPSAHKERPSSSASKHPKTKPSPPKQAPK